MAGIRPRLRSKESGDSEREPREGMLPIGLVGNGRTEQGQGWLEDFLRLRSSEKWGFAGALRLCSPVRRTCIPEVAGP